MVANDLVGKTKEELQALKKSTTDAINAASLIVNGGMRDLRLINAAIANA